jgi:hypothetical protein
MVLKRRELENYLLEPRAILAALREKCSDDPGIQEKLAQTSTDAVTKMICASAAGLHDQALAKRIRNELPGLAGGLLPRQILSQLTPDINNPRFASTLKATIERRVAAHLAAINFDEIVQNEKQRFAADWANDSLHLETAPGEEILIQLFEQFGTSYEKPTDTGRIARHMKADEIHADIREIIDRAAALNRD